MNIPFSKNLRRNLRLVSATILIAAISCRTLAQAPAAQPATPSQAPGLKPILTYIDSAWDTLTRSMTDCQSVVDPKLKVAPVVYLPAGIAEPAAVQKLASECNVRVEHLPQEIRHVGEIDTGKIQPHGLLYLEHNHVVPGGRFDET